ncbi:hypothetical protein JOM56_013309 [Amanita muscaria]
MSASPSKSRVFSHKGERSLKKWISNEREQLLHHDYNLSGASLKNSRYAEKGSSESYDWPASASCAINVRPACRLLKSLSIKQSIKYDDPESACDIPTFIEFRRLLGPY